MSEPETLKAGRLRAQRRRRREAIARVEAYRRWLQAGSDLKRVPPIPSKADYEQARQAGRFGSAARQAVR